MAEAKKTGWWVFHDDEDNDTGDNPAVEEQDVQEERSLESDGLNNWSVQEDCGKTDHSPASEVQSDGASKSARASFKFKLLVPALFGDFPVTRDIKEKLDFSKKRTWEPIVPPDCGSREDPKPHRIRLLSWNIEGLNPENIQEKTIGLCENILQDDPDVVFLQEVVELSQIILLMELPNYHFIPSNLCRYYNLVLFNRTKYFTAILVKKEFSVIHKYKLIRIPTTMGRSILYATCTIKGEKFCLMTSHLESTLPASSTRKKQLKKAFSLMKEVDHDHTVIFGGDLNLRDYELPEMPEDIHDIWEITGRREDAQFTWDMQYNDNLVFSSSGGDIRPRKRFDRLYIRYSIPKTVEPVYFELIGFKRLDCGKFCSDHWGLLTHLDILRKVPQRKKRGQNTAQFRRNTGTLDLL